MTPPLMVKKLSHYEILDEISRGGMGIVYRATDLNLGREVAIKVLPDVLLHDPDRRERLLHEARAAAALEHPHIGVIHEVGESDGVAFIAMELIRGEKLSDTLSRGPLSHTRALTLATEIAEGLARAHDKGIVHRDLKPANIIVTDDGHAKIIDFGLAKLVEQINDDAATASIHGPRTEVGVALGTAAYMSPEQARGIRVDHRSDVFSLGVTLYEMVAGRSAFQRQSTLDTMQAILTQPLPPLVDAAAAPADATAELQRIMVKATAKDPDERYQGMKDLIVDLRSARRRLESASAATLAASSPVTLTAGSAAARSKALIGIVAALIVAVAAVAWWSRRAVPANAVKPSGKPSLAVLYFENNTGDKSLDWMRTGLTDMMVTDLSQSPNFEVIGTDRLVQILKDLQRIDAPVLSSDVVQEIANRAGVDNVLMGSYVRSGGTMRITARLQDARTGRIVTAERVEGPGESGLFSMVDELTRRFVSKMGELGGLAAGPLLKRPGESPAEAGLDRGLTEVTTTSIEAYRYYAEGLNFHERGQPAQAVPLLEKAIEIDPNFAMAYAKLAVVHNNLVSFDKRDEYAKRALALTDRLTTRERYYIEGFYYSLRPETMARGLEAYQQCLRLHPEHQASRHNLGLQLLELERYPEAVEQYEELLRRGTSNPTSYENLVELLIQTGNVRRARDVSDDFMRRYPESAVGLRMHATTLIAEGHLDDAKAALEKAEALDPIDVTARGGRRVVALLQERWAEAQAINEQMARSAVPFERFLGMIGQASVAGARGQGPAAVDALDRAARVQGLGAQQRGGARNRLALALVLQGNLKAALAQAELAMVDARGRDNQFLTLQEIAIGQAGTGRQADAANTLAQLESLAKALPSERELRRVHWTRGEIARLQGDNDLAMAELSKAAAMLPARALAIGPLPSHGHLWFAAALAHIKGGHDAEAAKYLERLQAGEERAQVMDEWARSFYLLGQIYERRGDTVKAHEQYRHFIELWRDGDLERGWVAEAEKKVGS
jgi:serine/threonine protein kinase/tetratricopeptide (TPR) repeat protein